MPLWLRALKPGFKYLLLLLKSIWTKGLNRRRANTSYSSTITWSTTSYRHISGCSHVPEKLRSLVPPPSTSAVVLISHQENRNFTRGPCLSFLLLYTSRRKIEYKRIPNLLVSCSIIFPSCFFLLFFRHRRSEALRMQQYPPSMHIVQLLINGRAQDLRYLLLTAVADIRLEFMKHKPWSRV